MGTKKKTQHHAGTVLSSPVVRLADGKNYLEWQELTHGSIIVGGNGSGKTSGPGGWMMRDIMSDQHRPGMMILCVKPSERDRVIKIAEVEGRMDDIVIFSKDSPLSVNALEHELLRNGRHDVNYDEAVDLLIEIATLAENYKAGGASGGGSDDRYWTTSMELRIKRLLMLLVLSGERVTIANMRRSMIDSFSENDLERYVDLWEAMESDHQNEAGQAALEYENWCNGNYFLHCFDTANSNQDLNSDELHHLQLVCDYFTKEYPFISPKTRSIVDSSITGLFEYFTTGILKSHFDGEMSEEIKPSRCAEDGAIIIVDFPLADHGLSAVIAMGICKKIFQLTQQRRRVELEDDPRPVVLWVDEAHLVINATSDDKFQSICRETLTACVYITQSINSIKIAMGQNGDIKTKALLTNLGTVIACRNLCRDTNLYIAELIGKTFITMNGSSRDSNERISKSTSEQLHYKVPPEHMTTLKSGGSPNNFLVEAIAVIGGKEWSTGENFLEITFDQRGRPQKKVSQILSLVKSFF